MLSGLRIIRLVVGALVVVVVGLMFLGYVIYAANGILDQVEARDVREHNDKFIVSTATALADRLVAVANGEILPPANLASDDGGAGATEVAAVSEAVATETLVPTATKTEPPTVLPPTETPTQEPTETPTEEPSAEPTTEPSATAMAVAAVVETATSDPSETPLPSTETATKVPTVTPSVTPTATETLKPTVTPIPTNTVRPSVTPIPTNTPRPSLTPIPSETPLPTATFTPSLTPTVPPTSTYTPTIAPTATYVIQGTYALPHVTPVVAIPPAMPLMDTDPDVVNFLLLGSDTSGGGVGHTDVIILVSVNKRVGSVAMWHLPRDLFVYIPNHTMDRINLAYALGEGNDYPGGGFGLMKETIRYNLGIEVDHYARVDFDGYMRIIQELGGLDISVDCAISDWRLISPELDPTDEDNWEYYTLPIGRQELSPYMALWYARSRKTTNDLDRGRRQMDVLRAMWYQAREQGLFAQVTQLWPEAAEVVETDMGLTDVLSMVPLAMGLDMSNIARYSGTTGVHYEAFKTPDDGREVVLPNRAAMTDLVESFLTPPTENRLGRQALTVDVVDVSAYGLGFDLVAADRLAWEGFSARVLPIPSGSLAELTVVYDYTGQVKSSALEGLTQVLRVSDSQVISLPDPNRTTDFLVEIGRAYNSCVYGNAEDDIEAGPPIETPVGDGTSNSVG